MGLRKKRSFFRSLRLLASIWFSTNSLQASTLSPSPIISFAAKQLDSLAESSSSERAGLSVGVRVIRVNEGLRDYILHHRAAVNGVPEEIVVEESSQYPRLRSSNLVLDALFALTMQEVKQNSVSTIKDGNFSHNQPIPCHCFQTGKEWNYVWTRDIAYSVDLSLAFLDADRARQSLLFKTSALRSEFQGLNFGSAVIQDTGTGGSWPVSNDRVVWFLAAHKLLSYLDDKEQRQLFLQQIIENAHNTFKQERETNFSPAFGLYRGETSFLDWREQSYPFWAKDQPDFIAATYAVSTNTLHFAALQLVGGLLRAEGDTVAAEKYLRWAEDLKASMHRYFWNETRTQLYMALVETQGALFPLKAYDLLGQMLAIRTGLVTAHEGQTILAHYPLGPYGPAVLWPQRPAVPIYHNRAIWPFVTAYAYKAATQLGNAVFAERCLRSLLQGLSENFSHMENFEFTTLSRHFADGPLSGPVINSEAQLWSVAGFASLFLEEIFGLSLEGQGQELSLRPRIPLALAPLLFPQSRLLVLHHVKLGDKTLSIHLKRPRLPAELKRTAWLVADKVKILGETQPAAKVALGSYPDTQQLRIDIDLKLDTDPAGSDAVTDWQETQQLIAPREPEVYLEPEGEAKVTLYLGRKGENATVFYVYRNGQLLLRTEKTMLSLDLPQQTEDGQEEQSTHECFHVEQESAVSKLRSFPSKPQCVLRKSVNVGLQQLQYLGTEPDFYTSHGRLHAADWGYPGQSLSFEFNPAETGFYLLQVHYGNAFAPVATGITACTKKVSVSQAGIPLAEGTVVLPQQPGWEQWAYSTPLKFKAEKGSVLKIELSDHYNMSYFSHYQKYTGGVGGHSGPVNRINLAGFRLSYSGKAP